MANQVTFSATFPSELSDELVASLHNWHRGNLGQEAIVDPVPGGVPIIKWVGSNGEGRSHVGIIRLATASHTAQRTAIEEWEALKDCTGEVEVELNGWNPTFSRMTLRGITPPTPLDKDVTIMTVQFLES